MRHRRLAAWIAYKLRIWADRIDQHGAPRRMSYRFTFEKGKGIVFRSDGRGCPLWYYGRDDYELAHTQADNPS